MTLTSVVFSHSCTLQKSVASDVDPSMSKKQVIIMDEVDGMAGGDRGGVAQLISFIKKTHVSCRLEAPIIPFLVDVTF